MSILIKKYNSVPLVIRIIIGASAGMLAGVLLPQLSFISVLGELFVGALKAIAPILVLTLVTSSLINTSKSIKKRFKRVIFLYLLSTFAAALTAVAISHIFKIVIPVTSTSPPANSANISDVFISFVNNIVMNPASAISRGNYIGILTWSVLFALAFRKCARDSTKSFIHDAAIAVSKCVEWIIQLAPFGILGLVYTSFSQHGPDIFTQYGKLLSIISLCMLLVALVVNPLIVAFFLKKNPYPLVLKCLKESGIPAFFTRSSAANIPINLNLCKKLGLNPEYYNVAIPLGATINMNGAAITITIMSLSAAFSQGIDVGFFHSLILSLVSALCACGASGVSGGSLLLIPMACSLLGVTQDAAMQMVSTGFIIGILQDSLETALNSSGDVLFCATAEYCFKNNAPTD